MFRRALCVLALLIVCEGIVVQAQSFGKLTMRESDGQPRAENVVEIVVSPGTLSCTGGSKGRVCTLTTGGGGGGGTGDVVGPTSATDNAVVRFDLTTGKLVQNSVVIVGDTGNITGVGTLNTHTIPGGTDTFALLNATQTLANKTFTTPNLGTPSAAVLTNATGLPLTTGVTGTIPVANGGTNLTAATDDNVMVGNGTTWQAKAVPLCTDTGGNHLNYDTATNTFTCGTSSSGGGGGGITVGTTTITSGTSGRVGYNNAGVYGEYPVTGTAGSVVLSASPTLTGTVAMAAATASGTIVQTSASATAFESGPNGSTNPVFRLVNNVASQATGLSITGNAAGSGVTLAALSSGTSEPIILQPKGIGVGFVRITDGTDRIEIYPQISGVAEYGTSTNRPLGFFVNNAGDTFRINSTLLSISSASSLGWTASGSASSTHDTSLRRHAAGVVRVGDSATGAGSLLVGTSSGAIGTSGAGVLAFSGSTAPSTSPTDTVQVYSGDAAAADHNLYTRNEAGQINRLTGLAVRNSAQFDVTSSTTLATITGLTENVEAGRTYAFRAYVQTSAGAGGIKLAVGGTATATAISYEGELTSASDDNVVLIDRATALGTAVCDSSTTTSGTCKIEGVIQVNAAGTLVIQFAQSASNGTASSVLANQYLQLIPIS